MDLSKFNKLKAEAIKYLNESGILDVIPFTSEILAADSEFVYVTNFKQENPEVYRYILQIERIDFLFMINKWLDRKADFTFMGEGNDPALGLGVFGNFYITEKEEMKPLPIPLFDENKREWYHETFPVYKVLKFNDRCDMERG